MADPARAAKTTFTQRRINNLEACPCLPVEDLLNAQYRKDPPCKICKYESRIRQIMAELGR